MCQNCKSSELGIARQAEVVAATEHCKELNINPAIVGFIVKHAYQGRVPGHERQNATPEQVAAAQRHVDAQDAMRKLHEDYVWTLARKDAEARSIYFTHGDKRRASADPGLRDLDLSELGISPEQAVRFDRLTVEQDTIAREDALWLDAEQRS